MTRPMCTVPGCGRAHHGHGYCRTHRARWQRHGNPLAEVPIGAVRTGVSYRAAHRRVRAERGQAGEHPCAVCGGAAAVWCYGDDDPAELADARGRRYSVDPTRYRPCCRFCQRRAVVDRAAPFPAGRARPVLDAERAERLYRAGASSRGVAALMGVSRGVVLRALRTRAVPIRPPVAPQRRPRRYPITPRPKTQTSPRRDHQQLDRELPYRTPPTHES